MGYFKSIHNTVFESLKLIDIYSVNSLANLIFNNILYANLNNNIYEVFINFSDFNILIQRKIMKTTRMIKLITGILRQIVQVKFPFKFNKLKYN